MKDIEQFQSFVAQENLSDLWRLSHGDRKEFTWSKNNPFIARRLDYFLVADNVLDKSFDCDIMSVAQSDHRLIKMKYRLSLIPRGPSYWKHNDSLLSDKTFVDKMNQFITSFETEHQDMAAEDKWDLCKIKIKEECIAYSKEKSRRLKKKISEINGKLNDIDKRIALAPQSEELQRQRMQLKNELEISDMNKAKSAQIRSREKFISEGEKTHVTF